MINKKDFNIILLTFLVLLFNIPQSYSQIYDYETTRIQSSAGAGVASLLINESSLLNPASIAFFEQSTFYYQKGSTAISNKNNDRKSDYKKGDNQLITITDTSSPVNGGLSYQLQNSEDGRRIRYSTSLAAGTGKSSSLGLIYRYTEESSDIINKDFHQAVVGYNYIYSNSLSFGAVVVDPVQTINEYFNYTLGAQYNLNEFFTVIADIGSGDVANPEKSLFTKWAIQLMSFRQLFLRYGQFDDKFKNQRGFSYGLSWVGPKLSFDYAVKTSEIISINSDNFLKDEKLVETSLGLTVLF